MLRGKRGEKYDDCGHEKRSDHAISYDHRSKIRQYGIPTSFWICFIIYVEIDRDYNEVIIESEAMVRWNKNSETIVPTKVIKKIMLNTYHAVNTKILHSYIENMQLQLTEERRLYVRVV